MEFIYKVGPNYFSSMEKAERYRDKYYNSYPWIETIHVDNTVADFPKRIQITLHWGSWQKDGSSSYRQNPIELWKDLSESEDCVERIVLERDGGSVSVTSYHVCDRVKDGKKFSRNQKFREAINGFVRDLMKKDLSVKRSIIRMEGSQILL